MTHASEQSREPEPEVAGLEGRPGAEPEPVAGAPGAAGAPGVTAAPGVPTAPGEVPAPGVPTTTPETEFAARVPAAEPPPPPAPPATRRVVFIDVENTARTDHMARLIEHLAAARVGAEPQLVAVGNWRVIGQETARLLAARGAQLVHSAPSTGVRDWTDLRIAVSAGVWLAGARPGDTLEIVSDDRAFDAVGDVAAALGIGFRRLSHRTLVAAPVPAPAAATAATRQGRPRRGRRRRERAPAAPAAKAPAAETPATAPAAAHTAPHDELLHVVRELIGNAPGGSVPIDTLARTLKARGYTRTPGSPRLITRLHRIKEVSVGPSGLVTLVAPGEEPGAATAAAASRGRRRTPRRGRRRRSGRAASAPDG